MKLHAYENSLFTMLFLLACPFSVSFPILAQFLLLVLPAH